MLQNMFQHAIIVGSISAGFAFAKEYGWVVGGIAGLLVGLGVAMVLETLKLILDSHRAKRQPPVL